MTGTVALYVMIDQNKIEAKVVKTTTLIKSESTVSRLASKISISQIVPLVNKKDILRYLPDDMLNEQQKALKWEGIAETIEYTGKKNDKKYFEFIKAGNLQAAQHMVKQTARTNGYTVDAFHGINADHHVWFINIYFSNQLVCTGDSKIIISAHVV